MKHLNSSVVQAASNPGHEFVMSPAGQGFTVVVIVGADIGIIWLVFFKGRRNKG